MTTPHKHAALIKAWADGAVIQSTDVHGKWFDLGRPGTGNSPSWSPDYDFRIKPDPLAIAITALTDIMNGKEYACEHARHALLDIREMK